MTMYYNLEYFQLKDPCFPNPCVNFLAPENIHKSGFVPFYVGFYITP